MTCTTRWRMYPSLTDDMYYQVEDVSFPNWWLVLPGGGCINGRTCCGETHQNKGIKNITLANFTFFLYFLYTHHVILMLLISLFPAYSHLWSDIRCCLLLCWSGIFWSLWVWYSLVALVRYIYCLFFLLWSGILWRRAGLVLSGRCSCLVFSCSSCLVAFVCCPFSGILLRSLWRW